MQDISLTLERATSKNAARTAGKTGRLNEKSKAWHSDGTHPEQTPYPCSAMAEEGWSVMDEQMENTQFQQWIRDMEYPQKIGLTSVEKVPYDPEPICDDLGIRPNRFYSYWRGIEKGKVVRVSPSVTRLCLSLLARHRTLKHIKGISDRNPDLVQMMKSIADCLDMPKLEARPRRREPELPPEIQRQADDLRSQAVELRREAQRAATQAIRDDRRERAVELETQALQIEKDARKAVVKDGDDDFLDGLD